MNKQKEKQRLFDIAEYGDKVRAALENLKKTQQPGERSGKGSKTDVLQSTKKEISELVKKGYTTKQIADALSHDIFGILPKTITQIIDANKTVSKAKSRHTPPAAAVEKAVTKTPIKQKPVTELGDVE